MTPGAIIAMAKDGLIIVGIALLGWFLVSAGRNMVTAEQLKGLEQRVKDNAEQVQKWQQQKDDADGRLASDLKTINSTPAAPPRPVWVCPKPPATVVGAVPGGAGAAKGDDPGAGRGERVDRPGVGSEQAAAVDVSGRLEVVKKRIETAFAECRDVRDSWPKAGLQK